MSPGDLAPRPWSLVPVVHAVTTTEVVTRSDFLGRARTVMGALGARGALHLRAPRLSALELYRRAEVLGAAQDDTGCWLVVVERVDVAAAAAARGVQLTSESLTVADARRAAPALAVGASVHSLAEARAAAAQGAAWVVAEFPRRAPPVGAAAGAAGALAGAPAGTEPESTFAPVRDLVRAIDVPVVVIGGVQPRHLPRLRNAGAHGAAVIRGIWEAENAERAATDYLSAHDAQRAT